MGGTTCTDARYWTIASWNAASRTAAFDETDNEPSWAGGMDQARRDASGILALLPIHHPEHCIPEPAAIH